MEDETKETDLKEHRWRDAMELTANDRGEFEIKNVRDALMRCACISEDRMTDLPPRL